MKHKLISAAILVGLLAFTSMAEAKKVSSTITGKKVAGGKQFDIYVELKESKLFAATNLMLNIYATTVVVHKTPKRRR